jgi:hypothetical protein
MEFKSFGKIDYFENLKMTITQKVNGTNSLVCIYIDEKTGNPDIKCGNRYRWITPDNDNHGFAAHVYAHREEFIEKLGLGRHYGEWAGKGINSGEGLDCRNFYLFNHWHFGEKFKAQFENPELKLLPPNTYVVPVLASYFIYKAFNYKTDVGDAIDKWLFWLKQGSRLHGAKGFKRPEGIVVQIGSQYFKHVFEKEDTKWHKAPKKPKLDLGNLEDLMQPIRLEKLLSRDEAYMRDYPKSLGTIVKDYVQDLIEEQQATEEVAKAASRHIFSFVKQFIGDKYDQARAA